MKPFLAIIRADKSELFLIHWIVYSFSQEYSIRNTVQGVLRCFDCVTSLDIEYKKTVYKSCAIIAQNTKIDLRYKLSNSMVISFLLLSY